MQQKIEKAEDAWDLVSRFYAIAAESENYHQGIGFACDRFSFDLGVTLRQAGDAEPTGICILLELLTEANVIDYHLFRSMCQTLEERFPAHTGRHVWPRSQHGARERALWAKLQATREVYGR